jgi:hypothetical protein
MKTLLAIIMLTTSIYAADLRLVWSDNSDNEDGFEVERKVGDGEFVFLNGTGPNENSYIDAEVPSGGKLAYRVRAVNQYGESSYSNVVTEITIGPVAPSDLKVNKESNPLAWLGKKFLQKLRGNKS